MLETRVVRKSLLPASGSDFVPSDVQVLEARVVRKHLRQGLRATGSDMLTLQAQALETRVVLKR